MIDPGRLSPNPAAFWNPSPGNVVALVVDPKDIQVRAGPIGNVQSNGDPSPPGTRGVRWDRHEGRIGGVRGKCVDPVQGGFDLVPVEEAVHAGVVLVIVVAVVVVIIIGIVVVQTIMDCLCSVSVALRSKGDVGGSGPLSGGSGRGGISGNGDR